MSYGKCHYILPPAIPWSPKTPFVTTVKLLAWLQAKLDLQMRQTQPRSGFTPACSFALDPIGMAGEGWGTKFILAEPCPVGLQP